MNTEEEEEQVGLVEFHFLRIRNHEPWDLEVLEKMINCVDFYESRGNETKRV